MSELTLCNFCSLQKLKRRYGEENVRVNRDLDKDGWLEVKVRDEQGWHSAGHWFLALTDHCVC